MTRLLALTGLAAAVVLVAVLATGSSGEERYRVAAVFDTAKGMVAGQQVKIAGAVAGRVDRIDLAPGPKARFVLDLERRFAPFRADARCSIKPEGLISENFVECVPGTRGAPLRTGGDGLPEVPLARTTAPVSLQDVIDVFAVPTSERLRILVSQLGLAGAGRGDELNALLRRANPALASSRRVLDLLARQRAQISDGIRQTDQVLTALGRRDADVRRFVARAADVAQTTAARSGSLDQALERLPGMLRAVRPGLRALDRAAQDGAPLLASLREAGPGLTELTGALPAFTRAGGPALSAVQAIARTARPAVRRARPVVRELRRASTRTGVLAPEVDRLMVSLRDTGGIEGIMRLAYSLAALTSAYDETSHLITFIANLAPNCLVAEQAEVDSPGCAHSWGAPGRGSIPINQPRCGPQRPEHLWRNHRCPIPVPVGTVPVARREQDRKASRRRPARRPAAPPREAPAARAPERRAVPPVDLPKVLEQLPKALEGLLGKRDGDRPPSLLDRSTTDLLDFLLR
ncbi:MAG TPA: MlaD family protein [Baekduia sp.]|nr:MlaD family protein [Baekduia sp.]